MSTAPHLQNRLASNRFAQTAPRLAQAALQRARLTVVPRRRTTAPRVPFVTFVSVILLAGVIGLLMFNTSMQQASFQATALEKQATDLGARQEALEMDIQSLREPARVAGAAQRLGMVIPSTPAGVLHLETGKITGKPEPAAASGSIPLRTPGVRKPASLTPPPVKVTTKATPEAPAKVRTKEKQADSASGDGAPTLIR